MFALILILIVTSCGPNSGDSKRVILIAVENLSFNDFSCSALMDEDLVGFNQLCQESIFYTHAYTPSPYAPSAIASLFTGLYPSQHSLSAPNDYLKESYITINERIIEKSYKTSFFSAGVSMFKYTGLDQGVETFDDLIFPHQMFNNSDSVLEKFKKWHLLNYKQNFLSVLYFADPFYPKIESHANDGFPRFTSRNNQIKNISESILNLKEQLMKMNQWDHTTVIFLGLNGVSGKVNELKLTNLYSENIHVPLLIKPKQKKRDLGLNWKIDNNISLVDIGHYLENLFGVQNKVNKANRVDISKSLIQPKASWSNSRAIFTSVSWENKGLVSKAISFRLENLLYLFKGKNVKQYNSLIDKTENIELTVDKGSKDYNYLNSLKAKFKISLTRSLSLTDEKVKKLSDFVRVFWFDTQEIDFWPVEYLYESAKEDILLKEHLEYWALLHGKVPLLNEKIFNNKNKDYRYLIEAKTSNIESNSCLSYFLKKEKLLYSVNCKDNLSKYIWKFTYDPEPKVKYKLKINELFNSKYLKNKLKIQNIAKGYVFYGVSHLRLDLHWAFKLFTMKRFKSLLGQKEKLIYSQ